MSRKKLIFFDLDGTITDSAPGITKSAAFALKHFGIEVPDLNAITFFVVPPLEYTFMTRYGFSEEKAMEAVSYFRQCYREAGWNDCTLFPDTEEALRSLKEAGYRIALASSKNEPMCKRVLAHFHLDTLFDAVYGAEAEGKRRDKVAVLRYAMEAESDCLPEEMILVGDTTFDAEGAKAVGIDCLAVSYGFGDVPAMLAEGALGPADSMKAVARFFSK